MGAIAEWSGWEFGLDHVSHVSFDEDSTAFVQGGAVASPPSPTSSSPHTCGSGLPLDSFGHHRASCTRTGALGRRGFALESAAARVCREAGGRVTTNVMVRDLDLPVLNVTDSRRMEVVVDGLPLFGGSQLAVDTKLVCSLHSDGSPHNGAADTDCVIFPRARRRKERRYPELVGLGSRARFVVLALDGRRRRAHSSLSWRRQKLGENRVSCRRGSRRLGG